MWSARDPDNPKRPRAGRVTNEAILRYAARELPAAEAATIEAWLAEHPAAAATVKRYRLAAGIVAGDDTVETPAEAVRRAKAIFRRQPAERPGLVDRVATAIATLIYDSRLQPALAGYRGGGSAFQLSFRSDAAEIDLDAEPLETDAGSSPDRWRVIGQISAADDRFNVELTRAGTDEPASRTTADEHGVFTLVADRGRYDVRLRSAACEVVLPGIDLS